MSDEQPDKIKDSSPSQEKAPKVTQRITDVGYYYRAGDIELGPFTVQDEQDLKFDTELAAKLGVEPKEVLKAHLREIGRPTTFDEVADILSSTIRHDQPTKLILFSAGILTFTDEDQVNVLMSGESAGGKSYNALEVAAYFPSEILRIIATASPTAFFHDAGTWDEEAKVLRVDLRQKMLIFLDQPHYTLMERLRPLLSHDRRELLYKITDKSKRGALRTKNVVLEGFPTVVFCAAKLSLDEQERTRVFILSPETDLEKLEESLRLAIARVGDREEFKRWVESHPRRRWLKAIVAAIQAASIKQVVVEDQEGIYNRFLTSHPRLSPRHQRDLPRILALIKAHALLNFSHRERREQGTIVSTCEDVEAGFNLYSLIAKPNELGLSPQVYEIYEAVIKPLLATIGCIDRKTILASYHRFYGRSLSDAKLRQDILPALESAGLTVEQTDPSDKRRVLVCPPDEFTISNTLEPQKNSERMWGTPLGERVQAGTKWLSDSRNLDSDGWAPLDKFTEVVGGPEMVQHMLREGIIMPHASKSNKVRLVRK